MKYILTILTTIITLFYQNFLVAQNFIGIKTQFDSKSSQIKSEFPLRQIISLNKDWLVKINFDEPNHQTKIDVPFVVENSDEIILEKNIRIDSSYSGSSYILVCEGITGLEEISVNERKLNFEKNNLETFRIQIPNRLIKENSNNSVRIVLKKNFSNYESKLASQIFLDERKIGIYNDIYIQILSSTFISLVSVDQSQINKFKTRFLVDIENHENRTENADLYSVRLTLNEDSQNYYFKNENNNLTIPQNSSISLEFEVNTPQQLFWSPQNPTLLNVQIELLKNNSVIDSRNFKCGIKKFTVTENKFFLNDTEFKLKGITYFQNNGLKNSLFTESDFHRDIALIKQLGANSIRVINSFPSKKLMEECELNGILVFVDLNSRLLPDEYYSNKNNIEMAEQKFEFILNEYSKYASFAAVNVGNYSGNNFRKFTETLYKKFHKDKSNFITFCGLFNELPPTDFPIKIFGVEQIYLQPFRFFQLIDKIHLSERAAFISSLGYLNSFGNEGGYDDPYSLQSQAKNLSTAIEKLDEMKLSYFVHSFSDYRGVYHSSNAGRVDNSLFGFGLLNEYRDKKKPSFFVVKSYFNNEKLPKISQGNYTDNTDVIFIFFGLGLIVSLVLLVNSRRRFREYSIRALTRTYNFFQDIRDERVFSIIQLTLLSLIITTSLSLIYEGGLYFIKDKIYFEKFISIFDLYWLSEILSFLAWNPIEGILLISLSLFVIILITSGLIKFFNLFMRTKIFFTQAYTISAWSMFPFVLSLPLGSICIKLFNIHNYTSIVIGIIIFFHLWTILRLLQGVSILYEMTRMKVTIYFAGLVILFLAVMTLYFEFTSYSFQYFNYFFLTNN